MRSVCEALSAKPLLAAAEEMAVKVERRVRETVYVGDMFGGAGKCNTLHMSPLQVDAISFIDRSFAAACVYVICYARLRENV